MKRKLGILGSIGIIGAILWFLFLFFKESDLQVNLALKKDNNTYLFSILGSKATEAMIDNNQTPTILKTTSVIELDNELYVGLSGLENLVSLISGHYKIYKKEKKLYNGYITKDDESNFFTQKIMTEENGKIGDFDYKNVIQLKNGDSFFDIKWISIPNMVAEENCRITSIWVDSGIPGEKSTILRDIVVVKIKDIISFYGNNVKLENDKEDEILYLIEN
tara:strand:- start:22945 stop:23604 length:660 start_codon:yes stop_codon:yes gene_type:complete